MWITHAQLAHLIWLAREAILVRLKLAHLH